LTDGASHHHVLPGSVTVNRWLPGSVDLFTEAFMQAPPELPPGPVAEVADRVHVPVDVPPGEYTLAMGVVGPDTLRPVVQLGIQGRAADGWYPLSKLVIAR
jgi:hypothetical protein